MAVLSQNTNKQSISFIGCLSLLSRIAVRLCGSFNYLVIKGLYAWMGRWEAPQRMVG